MSPKNTTQHPKLKSRLQGQSFDNDYTDMNMTAGSAKLKSFISPLHQSFKSERRKKISNIGFDASVVGGMEEDFDEQHRSSR